MFNNSVQFKHNVTFNSVSGTLVKSCADSKMVRFHQNSTLASQMFNCDQPHRNVRPMIEVIVLQVMLCSDNQYLVEYVDKE